MKNIPPRLLALLVVWLAASTPAWAYRDLKSGTYLTRDPIGFDGETNQYTYVRQNPWTRIDPLGLRIDVTSTPEQKDENGKVTKKEQITIHVKAVVIDSSDPSTSAAKTKEQQDKIVARIKRQIEKSYSDEDKDSVWKTDVDIRFETDKSKVAKDDHVFELVDKVIDPNNPKEKNAGGLGDLGGLHVQIKNDIAIERAKDIYPKNQLERTAAHEFGHTAGLEHPGEPQNPIKNIPMANLMTQSAKSPSATIIKAQIYSIMSDFNNAKLNRGRENPVFPPSALPPGE